MSKIITIIFIEDNPSPEDIQEAIREDFPQGYAYAFRSRFGSYKLRPNRGPRPDGETFLGKIHLTESK